MENADGIFRVDGQVAVVTGGSQGLGRAIALALARAGADVWINHRGKGEQAAAVAADVRTIGRRAGAVRADVADAEQVTRLVDAVLAEAGRLDIMVNNAGILNEVPVAEMPIETWDEMITVNLRSVFLCTRAVLPHMLERGSGSIVNIASQVGFRGGANMAHYAAAKGGVLSFTRSVAREVANRGVRVNAIAPGPLRSPMTDPFITPEWMAAKLANQLLPRLSEVEEVAASVVFLASPAATIYFGQTLLPNAGGVIGGS